jgi:capsular exopolysaccharide synthesis family protein
MKLFEMKRRRSASAVPALREQRNMLCDRLSFTAAESYKQLRTNLMFALPSDKRCRVIGITSSIRNEGKSTTSINLAYTLAETGKKVLLVDADMRLPSVAKKLGVAAKPGLSNLLAGMCEGGDAVYESAFFPNWSIMPAGDIPPNPSELLGSEQMEKLLTAMSGKYDFIVIDLPPVDIVSDALAVGHWIDGIIVVVRADYTDRRSLKECMRQLNVLESKVLGFVMTGVEEHQKTYGKYGKKYYGKDYAYGYGRMEESRQRGAERTARDGDRRTRSERSAAARTGSQAGSRTARRSEDK